MATKHGPAPSTASPASKRAAGEAKIRDGAMQHLNKKQAELDAQYDELLAKQKAKLKPAAAPWPKAM